MTVALDVFDFEVMPIDDVVVAVPLVGPSPADPVVTAPEQVRRNHFGYSARTTTAEDINLVAGGDVVSYNLLHDDARPVPLGTHSFRFFGTTYTGNNALYVSTNGLVTFGQGNTLSENWDLSDPVASPREASIAPLWDDWAPQDGAAVLWKLDTSHVSGPNDRLILEWNSVTDGSLGTVTFQAILELDTGTREGDILFNYVDVDVFGGSDGAGSATVGIKNKTLDNGTGADPLLLFRDAALPDGLPVTTGTAIRIIGPPSGPVAGDDTFTTPEDTAATLPVLANDGAGPLIVQEVSTPDFGAVTIVPDGGAVLYTPPPNFSGTAHFTYTVADAAGQTDEASVTVDVLPVADAPRLDAPAAITANEADTVSLGLSGGVTDNSEQLTILVSGVPADATLSPAMDLGGGTWSVHPTQLHQLTFSAPDELATTLTVKATATDGDTSAPATTARDVHVNIQNAAPSVTLGLVASGAQFARGTAIDLTGNFTDPGLLDTHTAMWTLTSNSSGETVTLTQAGTVTGNTVTTTVNDAAHPLAAGVYQLKLTVTDSDGGVGVANMIGGNAATIVVFDAAAGFVGGIGWFNSPAGALASNRTWTGRAYFAFLSGYRTGTSTPFGSSGFLLKAAGSTFRTTSTDWVVVSGYKAQYKGTATVNGVAGYRFLVTVIDGQKAGGGGVDRIRFKVWNDAGVWYDNQPSAGADDDANPLAALGGGNIVIVS